HGRAAKTFINLSRYAVLFAEEISGSCGHEKNFDRSGLKHKEAVLIAPGNLTLRNVQVTFVICREARHSEFMLNQVRSNAERCGNDIRWRIGVEAQQAKIGPSDSRRRRIAPSLFIRINRSCVLKSMRRVKTKRDFTVRPASVEGIPSASKIYHMCARKNQIRPHK